MFVFGGVIAAQPPPDYQWPQRMRQMTIRIVRMAMVIVMAVAAMAARAHRSLASTENTAAGEAHGDGSCHADPDGGGSGYGGNGVCHCDGDGRAALLRMMK